MLAVLLNRVLLQLLRAVVQVRRDCREAWEVERKPLRRIFNAWARLRELVLAIFEVWVSPCPVLAENRSFGSEDENPWEGLR